MRLRVAILASSLFVTLGAALACETLTASQVAQDIQNSSTANQALKSSSCTFGGAAMAESSGNSCASNGNNFGVLQLTRSSLAGSGYTPEQYLALPPQQQIDIWAQQVGNSNTSGGYQTLVNNASIGGTPTTAGMQAACFQFGPGICRNDIAFMQVNNGQCPTAAGGGVVATGSTLRSGSANLDGNGQSICSWGQSIQQQINQAAATCNNNSPSVGTSCPAGGTTPAGAISPNPNDAPLQLPANLA
jgi:hypothetical protein